MAVSKLQTPQNPDVTLPVNQDRVEPQIHINKKQLTLMFSNEEYQKLQIPTILNAQEYIATHTSNHGRNQTPQLSKAMQNFFLTHPKINDLVGGFRTITDCPGFHTHCKEYILPATSKKVMDILTTSHPKNLWNTSAHFEMSYDRNTQTMYTYNDTHPPISTGMVFFLQLDIAFGLKLPVAFEIVTVDKEKCVFAFSYVRGNKSQGIQHIQLSDQEDGCHITHLTKFHSDSPFRDKFLYPFFHQRLLNDFYKSIEVLLDL